MNDNEYTTIEITFKNGMTTVWDTGWDDYTYDHTGIFVIKKDGVWVGIYNIFEIASIVVK